MARDAMSFRFLVVGFGSIGKRHVRNLRELFPESEIVILRHGDGCKDRQDWLSAGADQCVGSLRDALAKRPVAAIVANPASLHMETATVLAREGVHLLIEKPFSHNSKGIARFLSICNEKKVCLMIGYNLRFTPALQKFRKMLVEQIIGRIVSVKAEVGQYLPDWRPGIDYRTSVSAKKEMGGGVLLELSHEIDYLVWFFGEVESVRGLVSRQGDLEIDVEDTVHTILVFKPDKAHQKIIASLSMDFLRHDTTRRCTVMGTRGTLRWDGIGGNVERYDRESKVWKRVFSDEADSNYSYKQELLHFVRLIEHERNPFPDSSVVEAKNVIEIIEAIQLSSEKDKSVVLG